MYRLYSEKISFLDDKETYKKYYEMLSSDRKKKVDAYRFDKDKKLSILVEYLLRIALIEKKLISDDYKLAYNYNKYGKPYLSDFQDVYFSYSHSGEYAICVVSDALVGCDIELIKDVDFGIAKRFFTKNEYESIEKLSNIEEKRDLFYRYWTIKESYIKAIGLGLAMELNSFDVDTILDQYDIYENNEFSSYKCAICVKK